MGDFAGALLPKREGRDYRATDSRYNGHNQCCHPDCEEWIRDDAMTCKPHRDWYWAITHGQGEEDRRRRHRQIVALVAQGMTAVEAVVERNRVEALIGKWWGAE